MKVGWPTLLISLGFFSAVSGCGKDTIVLTCDEPQAYQAVTEGKRIEVPEDLDPLDEFKEIPIPRAKSEPRPKGSLCIDEPPSVISDSERSAPAEDE